MSIVIEKGKIRKFTVEGHAGFAVYGKDIVCAAVSAVTQTAAIGLQGYFGKSVEVKQGHGRLSCCIPEFSHQESCIIADAILRTMYWGLKSIEAQYKEHLRIEIEGGVLE